MALKIKTICTQTHMLMRRNNKYWETWIYFEDGENTYPVEVHFDQKEKPTGKQLDVRAESERVKLQDKLDNPEPEPEQDTYTKLEVEELLIEKKYLEKGQNLKDLPVKEISMVRKL